MTSLLRVGPRCIDPTDVENAESERVDCLTAIYHEIIAGGIFEYGQFLDKKGVRVTPDSGEGEQNETPDPNWCEMFRCDDVRVLAENCFCDNQPIPLPPCPEVEVEEPDEREHKIPNLGQLSSKYLEPIPIPFGEIIVEGNIVWIGNIKAFAVVDTETGDSEAAALVDILVGLCEGGIDDITKSWFGDALVYDKHSPETIVVPELFEQYGTSIELIAGTEEQLPYAGLVLMDGEVPVGYRGLACALIRRFPITSETSTIPEFYFQVYKNVSDEPHVNYDYDIGPEADNFFVEFAGNRVITTDLSVYEGQAFAPVGDISATDFIPESVYFNQVTKDMVYQLEDMSLIFRDGRWPLREISIELDFLYNAVATAAVDGGVYLGVWSDTTIYRYLIRDEGVVEELDELDFTDTIATQLPFTFPPPSSAESWTQFAFPRYSNLLAQQGTFWLVVPYDDPFYISGIGTTSAQVVVNTGYDAYTGKVIIFAQSGAEYFIELYSLENLALPPAWRVRVPGVPESSFHFFSGVNNRCVYAYDDGLVSINLVDGSIVVSENFLPDPIDAGSPQYWDSTSNSLYYLVGGELRKLGLERTLIETTLAQDIVRAVLIRIGFRQSDIDVSEIISFPIDGYMIRDQRSGLEVVTELQDFFGLVVGVHDNRLRVASSDQAADIATIELDLIGAFEKAVYEDRSDLDKYVELTYYNMLSRGDKDTQSSILPSIDSVDSPFLDYQDISIAAAVFTVPDVAKAAAEAYLFRSENREANIKTPYGAMGLLLEPGDVLDYKDDLYRLENFEAVDFHVNISAPSAPLAEFADIVGETTGLRRVITARKGGYIKTIPVDLHIPRLFRNRSESRDQVWFTPSGLFPESEETDSVEGELYSATPAPYGVLDSISDLTTNEFTYNPEAEVSIDFFETISPETVLRDDIYNGYSRNFLLIGRELVQFTDYSNVGSLYTFTGLYRRIQGTAADHVTGEMCYLLTPANLAQYYHEGSLEREFSLKTQHGSGIGPHNRTTSIPQSFNQTAGGVGYFRANMPTSSIVFQCFPTIFNYLAHDFGDPEWVVPFDVEPYYQQFIPGFAILKSPGVSKEDFISAIEEGGYVGMDENLFSTNSLIHRVYWGDDTILEEDTFSGVFYDDFFRLIDGYEDDDNIPVMVFLYDRGQDTIAYDSAVEFVVKPDMLPDFESQDHTRLLRYGG